MYVGPYQLLRPLGAGGMAEVWQARWLGPGGVAKTVALKWPRAQDTAQWARHAESFAREQQVSILMTHSNIAQVFDVGVHDGRPYMAMEWVDGINLAKLVERLRARGEVLGLGEVAYVVGEILRGLSYAHTLEHEGVPLCIVHRDVSPQNVLVSVSGEIKLVDFGIARAATHDTSGDHVKGKLRYMAPEQLVGNDHGAAVDLYAVGVILHELVAGARMRDARGEEALMAMVRAGVVPPLEGLPTELGALRQALLQPNPLDRPASARDALRLLSRWPGYRPLSSALARRVTDVLAVSAPRSGVHPEAELDPSEGERAGRDGVDRARRTPAPTPIPRSAAASGEVATAREPAPPVWTSLGASATAPDHAATRVSGPSVAAYAPAGAPGTLAIGGDGVPTVTVRDAVHRGSHAHRTATLDDAPTFPAVAPQGKTPWHRHRSLVAVLAMATVAAGVSLFFYTRVIRDMGAPTLVRETSAETPAEVLRGAGEPHLEGLALAAPVEARGSSSPTSLPAESASLTSAATSMTADPSASHRATLPASTFGPEVSSPERSGLVVSSSNAAEGRTEGSAALDGPEPSHAPTPTPTFVSAGSGSGATSSGATSSGATSTDATNSDATSSGATSSGATSSGSKASTAKTADPAPAPAEVVVKAGDFEWAVLRVDRREVLVEPRASLRLGPGRHKLAVRGPTDTDFTTLDPIDVESGVRYELRLRAPAGYGLTIKED